MSDRMPLARGNREPLAGRNTFEITIYVKSMQTFEHLYSLVYPISFCKRHTTYADRNQVWAITCGDWIHDTSRMEMGVGYGKRVK